MLVSQGLTIIAASLSAVVVARWLQPDEWGVFSAFLGLSIALGVVIEFGLGTWLLRDLSGLFAHHGEAAKPRARELVSSALGCTVSLTLLVATAGGVVGAISGERLALVLALSSLLLFGGLFATASVLEAYLRAQRRLRRIVAASVTEKYLLVMLVVVAVLTDAGILGVALAYVAAGLARCVFLGLGVFAGASPRLPSWTNLGSVLRKSLPFGLTAAAVNVVPKLDALCLLVFSATAAGYYALADRILGTVVILPVIAATTLYPFLARRAHERRAIWVISGGFGACGAALAAAGFLAAPELVPFVFGEKYADAADAVRLMFLALPLIFASNPLWTYGFSYGRERLVVAATLAVAFFGTGAILIGQASAGISGAAVGFLVRQSLMFVAIAAIAAKAARGEQAVVAAPFKSVDAMVP
jgi:O-antigen/teichoic acid export membrane protein